MRTFYVKVPLDAILVDNYPIAVAAAKAEARLLAKRDADIPLDREPTGWAASNAAGDSHVRLWWDVA